MGRLLNMRDDHVTDSVLETSVGGVAADKLIDDVRSEALTIDCAWLRFLEIVAKYGKASPAARAYVLTLAKRAAAAPTPE